MLHPHFGRGTVDFVVAHDLPQLVRLSLQTLVEVKAATQFKKRDNLISAISAMPQFRTKRGKAFEFDRIQDAIRYAGEDGQKAILIPAHQEHERT